MSRAAGLGSGGEKGALEVRGAGVGHAFGAYNS